MDIVAALRTTPAGPMHHAALPDATIQVHAGAPVRSSCHAARVRSIRRRGEVNLMPAGVSDTWFDDDPGRAIELRLPARLLHQAAEDMGLDPARAEIAPRYHFRDARIAHIACALAAEPHADLAHGSLYRESLGMALAVHLLGQYRASSPPKRGLDEAQLRRVRDHIEQHLDGELLLPRLAAVAGTSVSHFKTLFKRATGLPVHEYVIRRRVERAKALLLRREMPASQIALEAGFSHQSHMARCMRRVLGVTPKVLLSDHSP